MKVLISAFSFALAQEDAADMENSKIFQAIEMDNGRYSNYRNSLDRKYARSQERISSILLRQSYRVFSASISPKSFFCSNLAPWLISLIDSCYQIVCHSI